MNRRKLASDIDAGNESEAEGDSGEQEGDEEDRVVAQLDKTVQGVVQLPSGLLHLELHWDEVEDDQHDAEDCNGKASLEADGIHWLDVVLLHKLLLVGELAGIEGHGNDNEDVAEPSFAHTFLIWLTFILWLHIADPNNDNANTDDQDGEPFVPGKRLLEEDSGENADKDEVCASEHLERGGGGEGEGYEGKDPAGQMQNSRRDKEEDVEGSLLLDFGILSSLPLPIAKVNGQEEKNASSLSDGESPTLEHWMLELPFLSISALWFLLIWQP